MQTARLVGIGLQAGAIRILSRNAGRAHIVSKLSELPGVPSKIAQFLNSSSGTESRVGLHSKIHLDAESVLNCIEQSHPVLYRSLLEVDETPHVASLSQVHRGRLKQGDEVAIKVQFPGIHEEIKAQVDEYFALFSKYGPSRNLDFDLTQFKGFFSKSFELELDYQQEAKIQNEFHRHFVNQEWIRIPKPFFNLSNQIILVQEFVESDGLDALVRFDQEVRNKIAGYLIRFQLESLLKFGIIHGDLHSGNWGWNATHSRLVIYDFGATQEIPADVKLSLLELILLDSDSSDIHLKLWSQLGFDPFLLKRIAGQLPALTRMISEPFRNPDWSIEKWNLSARMNDLLGNSRWDFRLAGPPWFLGLMRSFQGLFSSLRLLGSAVNPYSLLAELAGQIPVPQRDDVSEARKKTEVFSLSKSLKIEVIEKNNVLVQLEFHATRSAELSSLIPKDVKDRIEKSGISLLSISERAIASRYQPQELFAGSSGTRIYRIWLE